MSIEFTELEIRYLAFVLDCWGGLAPYDGTTPQSNNPSHYEAQQLLKKILSARQNVETMASGCSDYTERKEVGRHH